MTEGKRLEDDIKKSYQGNVFIHRLKTRSSGYKNDDEIADFFIFYRGKLIILETKATKEKRLPFSMIRINQAEGIYKAIKFDNVIGGFLVRFYELDKHFFVPVSVVEKYLNDGRKSIPIKDMESCEDIIEVFPTKIRKSYKFDTSMLDVLVEGR